MNIIRNNPIECFIGIILGSGIVADLLSSPRHTGFYDEYANLPDYEPLSPGVSSGELSWTQIAVAVIIITFVVIVNFEKWQARRQKSASKTCQPEVKPTSKYDVWDNGNALGWLTADEICLRLNRGQLSESALFYLNGERLTFEQLGISYELPQSAPAPNWAG